jgi:hypothetical protein
MGSYTVTKVVGVFVRFRAAASVMICSVNSFVVSVFHSIVSCKSTTIVLFAPTFIEFFPADKEMLLFKCFSFLSVQAITIVIW